MTLGVASRGSADAGTGNGATEAWPTFGYDAANTGYAPALSEPEPPARVRWQVDTADSRPYRATAYSSPAVVGDTVYVGAQDATVYVVDAADGSERHQYRIERGMFSAPAVASDTLYVGDSGPLGDGGSVYAIDLSRREPVWRFEPSAAVVATPAPAGGRTYANTSDGRVHALDSR
jgi:outer membrane protein assembly factor BamB